MAVGKRVVSEAELILEEDTAIADRDSYQAYYEFLDKSKLKLKKDDAPTVFRIRPMTFRQRRHVMELRERDTIECCIFIVRCGLWGVSNYTLEGGDPLSQPERKREGDFGEIITPDWLERANLPEGQLTQIGLAVQKISEASIKN